MAISDTEIFRDDQQRNHHMTAHYRRLLAMLAALALVAVAGAGLVYHFADAQRTREIQQWQSRLAIVADSRVDAVNHWLADQLFTIEDLAANGSLQLYVSIIQDSDKNGPADSSDTAEAVGEGVPSLSGFALVDGAGDGAAEREYLANLLAVSADRSGFAARLIGPDVNANIRKQNPAGIALVNPDQTILVASPGFPSLTMPIRDLLGNRQKGRSVVSSLFTSIDGRPMLAFVAPVFALHSDATPDDEVALVLGVRPVDDGLFSLLAQPGDPTRSAESLLLRQDGVAVHYLSPRRDDRAPSSLDLMNPELAAAFAVREPNGFAIRTDYRGQKVLLISRPVAGTDWILMYKVDWEESLADTERRLRNQIFILVGALLAALLGMLAFWYYGTSRRSSEAAVKFQNLAQQYVRQRNFVHLVTDSQPHAIAIFDADARYRWVNEQSLRETGMDRDAIIGKAATAVLGPIQGRQIRQMIDLVLQTGSRQAETHDTGVAGGQMGQQELRRRVFYSEFLPLPRSDEGVADVLMVRQDITDQVEAREKRERTLRQMVTMIVRLVDRRDPYSADHSRLASRLAQAIAQEMGLAPDLIETVVIATSVMNLGKIDVPRAILTKQEALDDEEKALIAKSFVTAAELLDRVEFDGPVAQTLAQLQEHMDGSGYPQGLAGDAILLTARIAAVANAFVGMVSDRAWRKGLTIDAALGLLVDDNNRRFDRRVVVALANYLDNHDGRSQWLEWQGPVVDDQILAADQGHHES